MRLGNKVALLSGIGTGMGRATALLFAQEGARLVVTARRSDHLEETASRIRGQGGEVTVAPADVSVKSEADGLVRSVVETYGRVDILYCGAGGNFEPTRDFSDIDERYWQQTLFNTVSSLYNLSHAVRPAMRDNGGGAIVSIAASFSVRQEGNPAYAAAKGGVIGLCQSLARELYPDNIRVNAIAAGLFRGTLADGPVRPAAATLERTGSPSDIAHASLYLASDEAGWVTGQVLAVDGGVDAGARPLWQFER
jgi:NAD(P)-dependent dehydrogenase (short-subunit alcohol dehydrogenase family)